MRWTICLLGGLLGGAEPLAVPLALRPLGEGDRVLPDSAIRLDDEGYGRFAFSCADGWLRCHRIGDRVHFDRNGDGCIDEVDGEPVPLNETIAVPVRGLPAPYLLSFSTWDAAHLRLSSACVAIGSWAGQELAIYDQDVDGRFDGFARDAVVWGKPAEEDQHPSVPLMPVMAVGDGLQRLAFDGMTLRGTPVAGPLTRLGIELADGPNPLGLPAIRSARVELRRVDGQMQAAAVSGSEILLLPGEYVIVAEELGLAGVTPEQSPYLAAIGTWQVLSLAEGRQRLVRHLPARLHVAGSPGASGALELEPPDLVCADGRRYAPTCYGIRSEEVPEQALTAQLAAGGRSTEPVLMSYG